MSQADPNGPHEFQEKRLAEVELLTPSRIEQLLAEHQIEPTKGLGQNFVADPNTIRKIVRLAGVGLNDRVVEVGPGLGSLTWGLVEAGCDIVAIERDRYLAPLVADIFEGRSVRVESVDALDVDWAALLGDGPWSLVANLPYNIAATLILDMLECAPMVTSMTVMVQREVGERLSATPGSKVYGIPSVKLALSAACRVVAHIPADVFIPRPRVESVIIRIDRHEQPVPAELRSVVSRLLGIGFGQRRKMLRSTIGKSLGVELFEAAGIRPEDRPEVVGPDGWVRMAEEVMSR